LYDFFWHDYCDFYLEDIKYRVYGEKSKTRKAACFTARKALEDFLKMLAPFAPFATEEIHSHVFSHRESIHLLEWPAVDESKINEEIEKTAGLLHEVVAQVRKLKADKNLSLGAELDFIKISSSEKVCRELGDLLGDVRGIGKIKVVEFSPVPNAQSDEVKVSLS